MGKLIDLFAFRKSSRIKPASAVVDHAEVARRFDELSRADLSESIHLGSQACAGILSYTPERRSRARDAIKQVPELAWLLLFDSDGHIRQAGLEGLQRPPELPFEVVALALRLNDWVPAVRAAAGRAATQLFPDAPAQAVAAAAPYLLLRRFQWSRWTDEAEVLDEALARPDVATLVKDHLIAMKTGAGGAILRMALRFPALDAFLPAIAAAALHPAVRATALKAMITGKAQWTVGYGWQWIDKSFGVRRRKPLLQSRPLSLAFQIEPLIHSGLNDRFVMVRRVAADGLIEHRGSLSQVSEIANRLLIDRSSAIRDRADFLLRHLDDS